MLDSLVAKIYSENEHVKRLEIWNACTLTSHTHTNVAHSAMCQNRFDSWNTFFLFRNTHRYGIHYFFELHTKNKITRIYRKSSVIEID